MQTAALTTARIALLAVLLPMVLSRVQTHAEATISSADTTLEATRAQAVSASSTAPESITPWVLPREFHPWARFEPGSWREIEITTETFDEQGKVFGRSITTQKEILKSVADDSYVIEVQATVDVAGKRIAGPWNTRVLRLNTDRFGAVIASSRKRDVSLPVSVDLVPCQVVEVEYSDESRSMCDRIHISAESFPYVLQRETFDRAEKIPIENSAEDVLITTARSVPFDWEGRIIECATQQMIRRRPKGESQTLTLLAREIPGGEIRAHTTDFDSSGRRIRWSVQKLLAYGITHTNSSEREATATRLPVAGGQN